MHIGIFAKAFLQPSLEGVLNSVQAHGLTQVQFNMSCAGMPSMPEVIDTVMAQKIYHETHKRNIQMAAVSGTFNMIHPDRAERQAGINRLRMLAASCKDMGTAVITLCTGTRDRDNMWRKHPDNTGSAAWSDLLETMEHALRIAAEHNVILAFEPEPANVVDNAEKGRKLLDEMKSGNLKVVMDAANLFSKDNVKRMQETLDEAFDLLGDDIVIAHAKDFKTGEKELEFVAAGEGILDYPAYLKLLHGYGFTGALILHGLEEEQVAASVHFLQQKLQAFD